MWYLRQKEVQKKEQTANTQFKLPLSEELLVSRPKTTFVPTYSPE